MSLGAIYLLSMLATAVIVAVVYSLAQEAHLPMPGLVRQSLRRLGKLLGVLFGLALVVFIMSQI